MPFVPDESTTGRFVPDEQPPPGWEAGGQPTPFNPNGWKQSAKADSSPGILDFLTGSPRKGFDQPGALKTASNAAKNLLGATETAAAIGTGATTGMLGGAASTAANILHHAGMLGTAAISHLLGMNERRDSALEAAKALPTFEQAYAQGSAGGTYEPRSAIGQSMTEDVGTFLSRNMPALIAVAPELATTVKTAPDAIGYAKQAAKNAVTPTISQSMAEMVPKAEKFGIKLRPDQVSDNKYLKVSGEFSSDVPLSGSNTKSNQVAFDKALMKQIDPESNISEFTREAYARAMDKRGNQIGVITKNTDIPVDESLTNSFKEHLYNRETDLPDVRSVNENYVRQILDSAKDGVIPGEALHKFDSRIVKAIKGTSDGPLRSSLGDLHETLMDAFQRNLGPEELKNFKDARKSYAIGMAIEPVVAKEGYTGKFPAPQLQARLDATKNGKHFRAIGEGGDVGDLADIGKMLKEPRSSFTSERNIVMKSIAGAGTAAVGGVVNPLATAATVGGGYGAANIYNRLGPTLTNAMALKARASQPSGVTPFTGPIIQRPNLGPDSTQAIIDAVLRARASESSQEKRAK